MGNYKNLEIDFIKRTLGLIEQYESMIDLYDFGEQYNHTLLINCLLGLAILPKEKIISYAPKEKLSVLKCLNEAGIIKSTFHPIIKDTRDLITELRDSVAHFNINFVSTTEEFLIDRIQFINDRDKVVVADFESDELLPFIKWFADKLITNFENQN